MPTVFMLSLVILSLVILRVVMLSLGILSVLIMGIVMLSVGILSVVAPKIELKDSTSTLSEFFISIQSHKTFSWRKLTPILNQGIPKGEVSQYC